VVRRSSNLWTALGEESALGKAAACEHWKSRVPPSGGGASRGAFPRRATTTTVALSAMCEQALKLASGRETQTRGDTTIPSAPGPTWTPITALTSEITKLPVGTSSFSRSTSRRAPSGLSR
jgi:hypothetical protein